MPPPPPSLSSKLRGFRKALKLKKNFKKNSNCSVVSFDDDQLRSMARFMPVAVDSLSPKHLSSEQIDAFGDGILELMRSHTRSVVVVVIIIYDTNNRCMMMMLYEGFWLGWSIIIIISSSNSCSIIIISSSISVMPSPFSSSS